MSNFIAEGIRRTDNGAGSALPVSMTPPCLSQDSHPFASAQLARCTGLAVDTHWDGKSFLLLEEEDEVSPEKAAEMLRISRPTLLKKLDNGEIPFHYVGSHRRITVADVLAYRRQQKERSQAALKHMRDEADELGIYE